MVAPSEAVKMVVVVAVVEQTQPDQLVHGGAVCQLPSVHPVQVVLGHPFCPHHEVQGPVVQAPVESRDPQFPNGPYPRHIVLLES